MQNKSDLFERYLQAVRKYLPWKGQDDILAELRANLEAQLEEREAEQARPLSSDEMTTWLKQLGSPMQMAARYQRQQFLIGPALFPMYWWVLRMAFLWAAAIFAVVSAISIVSTGGTISAIAEAMLHLPGVLMSVAAWVTLIFAALEFMSSRYPNIGLPVIGLSPAWSPSTLPPLQRAPGGCQRSPSYAHAVAEVIFGYIALVWLVLIPHYPFLLLGPGALYLKTSPFRLAQIWWPFYWLVLALNVIQVAWNAYRLWRGSWQDGSVTHRLVVKAFGLLPIGVLLTAPGHVFVALKRPDLDAAHYAATVDSINQGVWRSLQVVAAIVVLQLLWEIGKAAAEAYRRRVTVQ